MYSSTHLYQLGHFLSGLYNNDHLHIWTHFRASFILQQSFSTTTLLFRLHGLLTFSEFHIRVNPRFFHLQFVCSSKYLLSYQFLHFLILTLDRLSTCLAQMFSFGSGDFSSPMQSFFPSSDIAHFVLLFLSPAFLTPSGLLLIELRV